MKTDRNTAKIVALILIIITLAGAGLYSVYSINDNSLDLNNREVRLVVTSSMDGEKQDEYKIPTIPLNSLIMIKLLNEDERREVEIGDILTFKRADGRIIVHRLVDIETNGDYVRYITKGDKNNNVDPDILTPDDIEGIVVGVSPVSGKIVSLAKQWFVWSVILIALAVVIIYSVREILAIYSEGKKDGGKS